MEVLDRTKSPDFHIPDKFNLLRPESLTLDNGIPVHFLKADSPEVLRIELIFEAGSWHESKPGTSFFTSKMLSEGTSRYNSKEIEEKIAFYGGFLELNPGNDTVNITVYCLSKHLNSILPVIHSIVKESNFPEKELENLKNITRQNLKVNLNKTSYLASVKYKELVFGKTHPYGTSLNEEIIDSLSREELVNYYSQFFTSGNCHIIISGHSNNDAFNELNKCLGKEKWGETVAKRASRPFETTVKKELVSKEGALQSSIRIGRPWHTISHKDYFKTYIFTEILGGYFGSRLMKNIREDKGYTYGINSSLIALLKGGYFVIGTDVKKEFTEPTLTEIYKEIKTLREEPVGKEELETVKNYMLGSFMNSINTPFAQADKFKTVYFNNISYDFYNQYIQAIKEITPSDIISVANAYFNEKDLIEVTAG